jgi:sec-independent protein translocase protein TatB
VNLDPEKLIVLFVIALLVLGPNRLPQAARTLGKGLAEVRKYTSTFQTEVNQVLAEPRRVVDAAMREVDVNLHPERSPAPWQPPADAAPTALPSPSAEPISATSEPVAIAPSAPPAEMPDDPTLN